MGVWLSAIDQVESIRVVQRTRRGWIDHARMVRGALQSPPLSTHLHRRVRVGLHHAKV